MSQTCFSISLRWLRIIVCAHVVYNAFSHAAIFFRTRCHMFMVHITWTSSTLILDQWTRNRWVYQRLKDIHCVQNWGVLQNGMWLIDRSSKLPSSSLWLISDSMHAPTAMLQFRVRLLRHRIIHGKYSQADIICMIDKSNYLIFQESCTIASTPTVYWPRPNVATSWQTSVYSLAQVPAAQSQSPHFPPFSFAQVPDIVVPVTTRYLQQCWCEQYRCNHSKCMQIVRYG